MEVLVIAVPNLPLSHRCLLEEELRDHVAAFLQESQNGDLDRLGLAGT